MANLHYAAPARYRPAGGRHRVTKMPDGQVVIRIEGDFDFELARSLVREAKATLPENVRSLVIELHRVTGISSFSLGALKLLCDRVEPRKSAIRLVACSRNVAGLFEPGILDRTFEHTRVAVEN